MGGGIAKNLNWENLNRESYEYFQEQNKKNKLFRVDVKAAK